MASLLRRVTGGFCGRPSAAAEPQHVRPFLVVRCFLRDPASIFDWASTSCQGALVDVAGSVGAAQRGRRQEAVLAASILVASNTTATPGESPLTLAGQRWWLKPSAPGWAGQRWGQPMCLVLRLALAATGGFDLLLGRASSFSLCRWSPTVPASFAGGPQRPDQPLVVGDRWLERRPSERELPSGSSPRGVAAVGCATVGGGPRSVASWLPGCAVAGPMSVAGRASMSFQGWVLPCGAHGDVAPGRSVVSNRGLIPTTGWPGWQWTRR